MKKKILTGLVIELLIFSATGMADTTTQVISDDFNDNTLDPAWSIIMTQAIGWSYTESGTTLNVTDVAATDSGWASVNLSQEFEPLSDFNIDFGFSWDSEDSDLAMQNVHVQVYTQEEAMIAYAGYSDGSFFELGAQFGKAGGTIIDEGPEYPLSDSGSAIVNINRTGNDINILWNGDLFISGTGDDLVNRVDLVFSYRVYEEGELTSFFGNESVDFINVEGTPTPDLIVEFGNTGHQYPPDPGADHQAEVELFIINIGEEPTEPKQVIDMEFFLLPIDSLEGEILVSTLQNISIGKLGTGRSKRMALSVPLYIPTFTSGIFILGVYIDSSDKVEESNEENNTAITTDWYLKISEGTPVFLPDLKGVFRKVSSFRDTKVRAEIDISNSGNVSTLRKQLIDIEICKRPCFATNDNDDISIATFVDQPVGNLKPGNSKTLRFVFDMPAVLAGHKFVAKIDSSGYVEELHEDNNEALSDCFWVIVE